MILALDSSVLVKLFVAEEGSDDMRGLFAVANDLKMDIMASELAVYEVGNALRCSHPGNPSNSSKMEELIGSGIDFLLMGESDAAATSSLADEEGLTFYDATHLHMARKSGAILVTEDKALLRKKGCISLANAVKHIRRLSRFEA